MAHLETASLGVWVGAGSRHEATHEQGLSHLLEHMAFKGTTRRTAQAIAEEMDDAGGDLNAATGVEQTAYYAHVLAEDTGLAIDILADILTESTFDKAELEREKGVILQEIGAVEDTPDDLVFDLFNATAFPDQPIGRAILGTPDWRLRLRSRFDRHLSVEPLSERWHGCRGVRRRRARPHRRRGRRSRFATIGTRTTTVAPIKPPRRAMSVARRS